jgi:hypothetical protein
MRRKERKKKVLTALKKKSERERKIENTSAAP